MEKIGASNYYFSFPAKRAVALSAMKDKAEAELETLAERTAGLKRKASALEATRCAPDRASKLAELKQVTAEIAAQDAQLAEQRENDPAELERLEASAVVCKQAANRWAENIDALGCWLKAKRGCSTRDANDMLKNMGCTAGMREEM